MGTQLQKTTNQTYLITKENWLQKWPEIPVKASSSAVEVLKLETPQLCRMGKLDGEMFGITIFRGLIADLVGYMGASWSPDQCDECGQLAYEECYWFFLAELKQFILRVKTGVYKSHKNFSPAIFMEFLQEYAAEMHEIRGQYYGQSKKSDWVEPENPVADELFNQVMAEITQWHEEMKNEEEQDREKEKQRQRELKEKTAINLRELGVPDHIINQYWK